LRGLLTEKYPMLEKEGSQIFSRALLYVIAHRTVDLNTVITTFQTVDYTVDKLIQIGLFRIREGYLECPYIFLWILSKNSPIEELREMDFCTYNELNGSFGKNCWQHWERFLANYRVIKSKIFGSGTFPLSELHSGALFGSDRKIEVETKPLKLIQSCHQLETGSNQWKKNEIIIHEQGKADFSTREFFVLNASGASAGDSFGQLKIEGSCVLEIFQAKHLKTEKINQHTYDEEWKLAATNDDIFILFTTGKTKLEEKDLPKRGGIVSISNFKEYFGIFVGRAFFSMKFNINDASRTQLKKIPYFGKKKS